VASSPTQQQGCNCGGAGMKPSPTTPAGQPPAGMQPFSGPTQTRTAPSFANGAMQVARPQPMPTLFGSPSGAPGPQMNTLWNDAIARMF
jgi:hypothetical protein